MQFGLTSIEIFLSRSDSLAISNDHYSSHQTLNSHKRNEYDAPTSNDPNSFQNLNVDSNSQLSLQVVPSNHQNHSSIPQALGSFGGESNVEGLKPENGHGAAGENVSLRTLIQKPLLSGSGTDKDYSGGEEETTSRRRRRSRWDPPPTEDGASSDGTVTGKRKRKSRWEDEPKSVIRLPDFMTGLTAVIDLGI